MQCRIAVAPGVQDIVIDVPDSTPAQVDDLKTALVRWRDHTVERIRQPLTFELSSLRDVAQHVCDSYGTLLNARTAGLKRAEAVMDAQLHEEMLALLTAVQQTAGVIVTPETQKVMAALQALEEAWDEEQRPNDHGKWADQVLSRVEDLIKARRSPA